MTTDERLAAARKSHQSRRVQREDDVERHTKLECVRMGYLRGYAKSRRHLLGVIQALEQALDTSPTT
jgi:hypothetical protein